MMFLIIFLEDKEDPAQNLVASCWRRMTLHAWKLLPKIGPSKCPVFPSPCSKFGAAIFLACEEQKFARLSPPLWGEWYEYTNSYRENRNPRGKSFLLIPCLPYSVQFSKNTAVVKKHFDTIYKFRNFWF